MNLWFLLLPGAALVCYVLCWLLIGFSGRMEALTPRNYSSYIRWEHQQKPLVGGMALFITWLVGCTLLLQAIPGLRLWPWIGAAALGFCVGLADDAWSLRPHHKLIAQSVGAIWLILTGHSIHLTEIPWADALITYFWVVGLMNSLNMLDNMDGIVALVGASIATVVIAGMWGTGQMVLPMGLLLAGALLGFYGLNRRPSQLYMGDSGSQFLGVLIALWGIDYVWNVPDSGGWQTGLRVALVFIVPLTDTTLVTFGRLSRGQSPAVGGRDHLTHHLHYLGIPVAWVGPFLAGITLLMGVLAWGLFPAREAFWAVPTHWVAVSALLVYIPLNLFFYRKGGQNAKRQALQAAA